LQIHVGKCQRVKDRPLALSILRSDLALAMSAGGLAAPDAASCMDRCRATKGE
jgi:hypothetical protein